jgi:serine phosphatase RsbU (regulator of sigma subunit)/tetratricopeptide (TPR) repeat protein
MIMKKGVFKILILLIALNGFYTFSQTRKLDSLRKILPSVHDTMKSQILSRLARYYVGNNPDTAVVIADSAIRVSQRANYTYGLASAYAEIGHAYNTKGKYDESLKNFLKSLELYTKIGHKRGLSNQYNNLGNTYAGINDKEKALEAFTKGYELATQEPKDDFMTAVTSVGMASCYLDKGEDLKAIQFYIQAWKSFHASGSKQQEGVALTMLGETYLRRSDLSNAENYFLKSISLFREINDEYGLGATLGMMGKLYEKRGLPDKSLAYHLEALEIHERRKAWDDIKNTSAHLVALYKAKGDYVNGFKYQELYMQFKDSVFNIERNRSLAEAETKYESEKKEQALKLKNLELEKSQTEVSQRNMLIYVFIGAFILFGVLLYLVYIQFREKKRANLVLEKQFREISEKNTQIEHQKNVIEEKNKDITDSINYSRHIQQAILPSESLIQKTFPDSYFIYKPKDIISGDFYFIENTSEYTYFAVVDCTGHGVPGALLSVFAQNTLKKIISTKKLLPNEVLSEVCREFKANLGGNRNDFDSINDGMDIALACLDKSKNKLYFSGAKNPLILMRDEELHELKADRWGISGRNEEEQLNFTNHEVEIKKGDKIYLFSDGFIDQFGGPKGKKFKYKQLQELLQEASKLILTEQKKYIENIFESWKGGLEQLDDVTLICVSL